MYTIYWPSVIPGRGVIQFFTDSTRLVPDNIRLASLYIRLASLYIRLAS